MAKQRETFNKQETEKNKEKKRKEKEARREERKQSKSKDDGPYSGPYPLRESGRQATPKNKEALKCLPNERSDP